jgi:hypothetical protein
MNFHRLFAETIANFDEAELGARQAAALRKVGLSPA